MEQLNTILYESGGVKYTVNVLGVWEKSGTYEPGDTAEDYFGFEVADWDLIGPDGNKVNPTAEQSAQVDALVINMKNEAIRYSYSDYIVDIDLSDDIPF